MSVQWFEVKLKLGFDNDLDGTGPDPLSTNDIRAILDDHRNYRSDELMHITIEEVKEIK